MANEEIWIQLYVGKDKSGSVFDIDHVPKNISALKKAVAEERKDDVGSLHYSKLDVYNPGTEIPPKDEAPLRPGKAVPTGTTDENPLRVVAPPKQQETLNETQESGWMPREDMTGKILTAWSEAPPKVPSTISSLKDFVASALPCPIPADFFQNSFSVEAIRDVIDDSNKRLKVQAPLVVLREKILSYERPGTTEDTLHGIVDDLVVSPIRFLSSHAGVTIHTDRNSADPSGTTQKGLRPDVLVWLPSGVLAFKGEEKADAADLQEATMELSAKLSTFTDAFFGSLQYQLCFAMGGLRLVFCAIERKENGKHQRHLLTDPIELSTVRGRGLCVRYVVNISKLLIAMHRQDPIGPVIKLGATMSSTSSEVHILGDYIIKKPKMCTGASILKDLYTLLEKSRGVHGLVQVFKSAKFLTGNRITLYLGPVGTCGRRPESIEMAKVAGKSVLTALQFLHTKGWVHRDIRPDNVMFADQNWYLVDLEWANLADRPVGQYRPHLTWTPPEIIDNDSSWTTAGDMWQFQTLLSHWGHLNENGQCLLRLLQNTNPLERIGAEEALRHPFFD
jgi:hypothetical protein